jgi:hypothetical protein
MRPKQAEIDMLSNNINVSEIVSEQGYIPSSMTMLHGELILAIEGLAKDIGSQPLLLKNYHNEIEWALDDSEMVPSNEECIRIIHNASSKIRELRELIESLSKKLCISENADNLQSTKLKRTIDKLKIQNRNMKENFDENIGNPPLKQLKIKYNNYIPKAPVSKHTSDFLNKHNLRSESNKSIKAPMSTSHNRTKSSLTLGNKQYNLKSMKAIKERLNSPSDTSCNIDQTNNIVSSRFTGVPFKTYTLLQNSASHRSQASSSNIRFDQENDRNLLNLISDKLEPQKTLDVRTKHEFKYSMPHKWLSGQEVILYIYDYLDV